MVNGALPRDDRVGTVLAHARNAESASSPGGGAISNSTAFAQILGKFYFFELRENLRRILLDYGQKRPRLANPAFSRGC